MIKTLTYIVFCFTSISSIYSQSSYQLGFEIGGDFVGQTAPYSLYYTYTGPEGNLLKDVVQDHADQGVSIFINNVFFIKNNRISVDVGCSYLSHSRYYDIGVNSDTAIIYGVNHHTFYWRYRLSYNYRFNIKDMFGLQLGLGVSGQDFVRDFNNKESRNFKKTIYMSPEEWEFEVDEYRRGGFTFTPFVTLALDIPLKKNSIEVRYSYYIGAFIKYYSSNYYTSSGGLNMKQINLEHKGRNNHSISIAFNLNLVDNL